MSPDDGSMKPYISDADDVGRQHPHGGAEQRDVDLEALAGALALVERGGDAARERHAADEVAERGTLLQRRLAGGREAVGDAAARPERHAVVAAAARVGAAAPLAGAAGVDQARVDRPQIVPGEAQALARVVEEAGEEDVGAGDQPVEQRAALGLAQVDAEAALVASQVLDEEVPPRRARG